MISPLLRQLGQLLTFLRVNCNFWVVVNTTNAILNVQITFKTMNVLDGFGNRTVFLSKLYNNKIKQLQNQKKKKVT